MPINKYLKWTVLSGIFILPFVPFVISSSLFFPYITGKAFIFRFLVEIIFGAWAILALRDRNYRLKWSWLFLAIFAFSLIIGVANIFSENPAKSFWSNFERMEGYVTILHLLAYFVVLAGMLKAEKLWRRLWNTTIAGSVIMCFYGLLQLAGAITVTQGGTRLDGTLGNATYLAVYMLIHIFLTLFMLNHYLDLWTIKRNKTGQSFWACPALYVYIPILIMQVVIIYNTATRGSILGLIGGLFVSAILIAIFEKRNIFLKKTALGGVIAIVALVGVFLSVKNSDFVTSSPILSRFANISWNENKTQARGYVWPMALKGFTERPILGWGQESFNYIFNKNYNPAMYGQEQWFDRTHNVILDWLVAGGLLGLLGYLSIFLASFWLLWRLPEGGSALGSWSKIWQAIRSIFRRRSDDGEPTNAVGFTITERSILTGLLLGYFFHNIFVFDNLISYIFIFTIFAYIHSQEASRPMAWLHKLTDKIKMEAGLRDRLYIPVIAIVAIFAIYFFNYKPLMANLTLIDALQNQVSWPTQNISLFQKAIAYNTVGVPEIREQLIQFALNSAKDTKMPEEIKGKLYDAALAEIEKQVKATPNDARYFVFGAMLTDGFGQYVEGEKYLLKALELSPNKQSIMLELANNYLNVGRGAEAITITKKVLDLAPQNNEARLVYALTLMYGNKKAEGLQVLQSGFGTEIIDDDRLLRAYASVGEANRAVAILELRLSKNPNDVNSYTNLAYIYYGAGQKAKAIVALQKIAEIKPELKAQVEAAIKQVQTGTLK